MKRLATFVIGLAILVAMLAPGDPVSTQGGGDAMCAEALAAAQAGASQYGRYEIVWGSGGSGAQVVLGTDGDDVLDGGSGNDLLCGFAGSDVLRGLRQRHSGGWTRNGPALRREWGRYA